MRPVFFFPPQISSAMSQKPESDAYFTTWQPHKVRHCGGGNKRDNGKIIVVVFFSLFFFTPRHPKKKKRKEETKKKRLIERFGASTTCGDNGVGGTMEVGGANVPQWLKAAKKRHRSFSQVVSGDVSPPQREEESAERRERQTERKRKREREEGRRTNRKGRRKK